MPLPLDSVELARPAARLKQQQASSVTMARASWCPEWPLNSVPTQLKRSHEPSLCLPWAGPLRCLVIAARIGQAEAQHV